MNHFITICRHCNTVINQCRCPSKDKEIIWDTCKNCINHNDDLVAIAKAQATLARMTEKLGASWMEITINNDGRLWLTWDRDDQWVYDEGDLSAAFDTAVSQVEAERRD